MNRFRSVALVMLVMVPVMAWLTIGSASAGTTRIEAEGYASSSNTGTYSNGGCSAGVCGDTRAANATYSIPFTVVNGPATVTLYDGLWTGTSKPSHQCSLDGSGFTTYNSAGYVECSFPGVASGSHTLVFKQTDCCNDLYPDYLEVVEPNVTTTTAAPTTTTTAAPATTTTVHAPTTTTTASFAELAAVTTSTTSTKSVIISWIGRVALPLFFALLLLGIGIKLSLRFLKRGSAQS